MSEQELTYEDACLYLEKYKQCRDAGDDEMNARLRIVEDGCPVLLSEDIQRAFMENDDGV